MLDVREVVDLVPFRDHGVDSSEDDPHFWQDPLLLAKVGDAVAEQLAKVDPDHADDYAANAADLRSDLETLDQEYAAGLADCERDTIVVSHDAFGYLQRYGVTMEAILGLSPDSEPTPADLARLQDLIQEDGITTVFSESLASPETAESLAHDMGVREQGARPDRGPHRRDRRRGLPFPHARQPRRPRGGERLLSTSTEPVIELEQAAVAIAGRPILRGIDLPVAAGEFVALMGANGSGKSTLVRALTGLRPLAAGSLSLFGTPFDGFQDWQRVGFVPQRGGAGSGVPASVWEVVASGRLTRRRLLRPLGRADRAAIADALEVVGLAHRARDGVSTLSGGQQQRVLIARALAGEPELFFLDEPTAGVDLPNQQVLADTLETLSGRGSTIVLVAHELGPMAPLIDRAVVMRDGRVAYDGPPLASDEVATAHLDGHHHHHSEPVRPDHAPHVSSPLEPTAMTDYLDLLGLPFMQRAIIAAIFTGLAAPAVGTYLVQRRLALMGDGIGHVAVTGVALGLLTGASPTWTAVIVAVLGATAIEVIRERGTHQRRRRAGAAVLRRARGRRAAHRVGRAQRA